MLSKERKDTIIGSHQNSPTDTGSPEVQIALLSERIKEMTKHMSVQKQDFTSRVGLMRMVGKRKRLLAYLKREDVNRYEQLIQKLRLRK